MELYKELYVVNFALVEKKYHSYYPQTRTQKLIGKVLRIA